VGSRILTVISVGADARFAREPVGVRLSARWRRSTSICCRVGGAASLYAWRGARRAAAQGRGTWGRGADRDCWGVGSSRGGSHNSSCAPSASAVAWSPPVQAGPVGRAAAVARRVRSGPRHLPRADHQAGVGEHRVQVATPSRHHAAAAAIRRFQFIVIGLRTGQWPGDRRRPRPVRCGSLSTCT